MRVVLLETLLNNSNVLTNETFFMTDILNPEHLESGQIVVFKNPYPNTDEVLPDGSPRKLQLLEVHDNGKCLIAFLEMGMYFIPTKTVLLADLTGNIVD